MKTNTARRLTPASPRPRVVGNGPRMESLIETYRQHHISQLAVAKEQEGLLRNYFPPLHRYAVHELTPLIVTAWFHDIGKHSHAQANKCLSILRTCFERAREWKLFQGDNPAQHVRKYPRLERERFVTPEEMPRLQWALSKEYEDTQCFFLLCLLVGCRKMEALTIKWADLDADRRVWRKPFTKTKRTHLVPVPLALLTRILALPRTNAYVFATSHRDSAHGHWSPTVTFRRWQVIRTAAGLPDVTIHDLRRTCASWLCIHGANMAVISKGVLNHTDLSRTGIYTRLNVSPVANALEANSVRMLGSDTASAPTTSQWPQESARLAQRLVETPPNPLGDPLERTPHSRWEDREDWPG